MKTILPARSAIQVRTLPSHAAFAWIALIALLTFATLGSAAAAELVLQWRDNSNNEAGFKIERSLTGAEGDFAQIAVADRNATTFKDTGLTLGTTYYYRVRATNQTADSAYTPIVSGTPKLIPTITTAPTAGAIVFGQALSASTLSGGAASVPGSFAFTAPTDVPAAAGSSTVSVTFTPTDSSGYASVTLSVSVMVNKATPSITTLPTAAAIGFGQALSASSLSGGAASVPGAFAFTAPATVPAAAGSASASITFTPADTANYAAATAPINVTVNKAATSITTPPTASAITFGQTLSASTLSGGVASVPGAFAFTAPATAPAAAGSASVSVTFTPTDSGNYAGSTASINVTVNKAVPSITTPPTASAISFGQALSASTLSGGAASVPGAFTFTVPATVPAAAGATSASVTFTPADTANYATNTTSVPVSVAKATPTISMVPNASTITFGQALAASILSGGAASVPGSFAFTSPGTIPAAAGVTNAALTFTPTDSANYNTTGGSVSVTVDKATATVILGGLSRTFDGSPKAVTVATNPAGIATTVTYDGGNSAPTAIGSYAVVATIADVNYTGSASGTLAITAAPAGAPTFTTQPVNTTAVVGQHTTLVAVASGTPAPTYQWQYRANAGQLWQNVPETAPYSGSTSGTLIINTIPLTLDGHQYQVIATSPGGSTASNTVTLSVTGVAPAFAINPSNRSVTQGTSTFFNASATGNPNPTYKWQESTDGAAWTDVPNVAPYSNVTTDTLSLSNIPLSFNGRRFRLVATNPIGFANSAEATLTVTSSTPVPTPTPTPVPVPVNSAPSIATQPQSQTVSPGGSVTFTVSVGGSPTPTLSWRKDGTTIAGATGVSLTLSNVTTADAGGYSVVATNTLGTATSATAVLTVQNPAIAPAITTQPVSQNVPTGTNLTLTVVATGNPTPTYQWRFNGTPISGATSASLTLNNIRIDQSGGYAVQVTNSAGSVTSQMATITVVRRDYSGTYFGELSGGGTWALYVRSDNTATYIAYLPDRKTTIVTNFTVNEDGSFTATGTEVQATPAVQSTTPITGPTGLGNDDPTRFAAQAAPISFTLTGSIASGRVTANLGGIGQTANGSKDSGSNSAAGFYNATALGAIPGNTYSIVGTSGQALVITIAGDRMDAATGTIGSGGQFSSTTTTGASLSFKVDPEAKSVQVSYVPTGSSTPISFAGVADVVPAVANLVNLSIRAQAGSDSETLIVGFVVSGSSGKSILLRGAGPALIPLGLTTALADPVLTLYSGTEATASNDDWDTANTNAAKIVSATAAVGAFPFATGSRDAALLVTPPAGTHSVQLTGKGTTGVVLFELYDTAVGADARLSNVSARCFVGSGASMPIIGFVVDGNVPRQILVRAVGPGLSGYGVTGVLADPQIEIFQGVTRLHANDNWDGSQAVVNATQRVSAFSLTANSRDAVLLVSLQPGVYTAVVSGVGGGTGVALMELYEVPATP